MNYLLQQRRNIWKQFDADKLKFAQYKEINHRHQELEYENGDEDEEDLEEKEDEKEEKIDTEEAQDENIQGGTNYFY